MLRCLLLLAALGCLAACSAPPVPAPPTTNSTPAALLAALQTTAVPAVATDLPTATAVPPTATRTPTATVTSTVAPSATRLYWLPTLAPAQATALRVSTFAAATASSAAASATAHSPTATSTPSRSATLAPTRPRATPTFPATAEISSTSELLLPDLRTLPMTDLVVEVTDDEKRLLHFTNLIINWGPGILEVVGKSDAVTNRTVVTQDVYHADGTIDQHPAGIFIFHPAHNHWHFENFSRYEVWSVNHDGAPDTLLTTTSKVGYCLRDTGRSALKTAAVNPAFLECERELQGMSSGWVDVYEWDTEGQTIDTTDMPDGVYALTSIVDPDDRLLESNDKNNAATVFFEIKGDKARTIEQVDVPQVLLSYGK